VSQLQHFPHAEDELHALQALRLAGREVGRQPALLRRASTPEKLACGAPRIPRRRLLRRPAASGSRRVGHCVEVDLRLVVREWRGEGGVGLLAAATRERANIYSGRARALAVAGLRGVGRLACVFDLIWQSVSYVGTTSPGTICSMSGPEILWAPHPPVGCDLRRKLCKAGGRRLACPRAV
jgi:hypothetical protein